VEEGRSCGDVARRTAHKPFLFLLYEFMGIVTNLVGGWVGARSGLNRTLLVGLSLQIVALAALTFHDASWPEVAAVAYVMGFQALSGVAWRPVPTRCDPDRFQERAERHRLFPGRRTGTLLSGVLYLRGGLDGARWGSAVSVAATWLLTLRLSGTADLQQAAQSVASSRSG